jgi:predicted RNase H-like HicB family nuclease
MRSKKTIRKHRTQDRPFTVLIEQDKDGFYVASVPALRSCYTQAKTLEKLSPRIREVVELCLEGRAGADWLPTSAEGAIEDKCRILLRTCSIEGEFG